MDQFAKLGPFAALIKLWSDLNSGQRAVLMAFVGLAVAVVIAIAIFASKPRMAVLFSGLETEDAGAVVQKLNDQKIQYELSGNGNTISVAADKVYDVKMQLATQGLPAGGSAGFELFDKSNFGMTEFTERLNYQRALQGELTRTICRLAPVLDARVHIVIPEEKLFTSDQDQTTASVVLKLRQGMPLSDDQTGGIVHLVSSAVEGLKTENVTVVDTHGNVLSEAISGSAAGASGRLTSNQSKWKKQYEAELSSSLQSMLTRICGPDKAVVRVSAAINFDQRQMKAETYEPAPAPAETTVAAGVLSAQDKTSEDYKGGLIPSDATPTNAASGKAGDEYNRTQSTSKYEINRKIEETVSAPGQVTRLCVAVLVDNTIPQGQVAAIRQAVTAAAGIDPTRKDMVTVQRLAFDTKTGKDEEAAMAKASRSEMIMGLAKNIGAVVLLLVFLIILKSIVKSIRVQAPPEPVKVAVDDEPPPTMQSAMNMINEVGGKAGKDPGGNRAEVPKTVTESSPEELANLVRNWMVDQ